MVKNNNQQNQPRKERSDKKTRPRKIVRQDITKDQFLAILGRACRPIEKPAESDSSRLETSESHCSGNYSERNTH